MKTLTEMDTFAPELRRTLAEARRVLPGAAARARMYEQAGRAANPGSGYAYGDGNGSGYGYGSGYGHGDGDGSGYGDGYGYGSAYGYDYGDGYGDGDGHGYGYGDGYWIAVLDQHPAAHGRSHAVTTDEEI